MMRCVKSYSVRYYLEKYIIFAGVYAFHGLGYMYINSKVKTDRLYDVSLPIDKAIPLIPEWSWIYELIFIFPIFLVLILDTIEEVKRVGFSIIMCDFVAYPIFLMFPVMSVRPEVPMNTASEILLNFIYYIDLPTNCFPSLHVAVSMVSALAIYSKKRIHGLWALPLGVLISLSTLFTKQHYFLDVVSGLLLAMFCYYAFYVEAYQERLFRWFSEQFIRA
ncbi:MAG: phosphatase PAP2 family protein [Deltaproteobacteria bacterium]|nr:phosphatase PAP2 family protein [Deltaproteobacteria bacterium]